MLQPPKGAHFEKESMNKLEFLEGVLTRLKNDVGEYMGFVQKRNQETGVGIGFWGSIRLLMPIVEALANTLPKYHGKAPLFLREELGVKTPNIVWILYRHSLAHNDLLQHGRYGDTEASWGVSMFGLNHIIQSEVVSVDSLSLYNDLVTFLEKEISSTQPNETVEVIRGVIWEKPSNEIADEFESLKPKH